MEKTLYSQHSALFAQRLRTLREESGMTQRQLAKAINRDHAMIAKIELGQRRVDVVELYWLLQAMGADVETEVVAMMKAFQKAA